MLEQGCSKAENSGGGNKSLNFNRAGARFQKNMIFGTIILNFSQN